MCHNLIKCFSVALQLTLEAGKIVRKLNSVKKEFATKLNKRDVVTEVDKNIENILINTFIHQFPNHKIIGEETSSTEVELGNEPTWIIDPIDGTLNFVHSFPYSCISIALAINKDPVIGIVYNPVMNHLFTAQKGQGAFFNNRPMKVSGQKQLNKALLNIQNPVSQQSKRTSVLLHNMKRLIPLVHGTRTLGSAALSISLVALGVADGYYGFGNYIWDIAAAELLVKEAGGVVIDPEGGPYNRLSGRILCASSHQLAEQIASKLVQ